MADAFDSRHRRRTVRQLRLAGMVRLGEDVEADHGEAQLGRASPEGFGSLLHMRRRVDRHGVPTWGLLAPVRFDSLDYRGRGPAVHVAELLARLAEGQARRRVIRDNGGLAQMLTNHLGTVPVWLSKGRGRHGAGPFVCLAVVSRC